MCRSCSDVQGFINPHGFAGKGSWGKGRGHGFRTLTKPLPSMQVGGYPRLFGRVRVVDHSNFSQPGVEVHHVPLMTPSLFWPFTIILSFFILFHSFSIHPEFITKESRVGAEFSFVRILNFEIASGRANTQKE